MRSIANKDELSKGFPADGKFTSYKSLYLLRSRAFNGDEYNNVINSAAIALLGIAKYTDFFGTKYDFRDIQKLRRNDTAIFVGALLFKFAWIQYSRISFARLFDLSDRDYKKQMEEPMCESLKCLGYLFPLTCAPNCKSTVSYGAKHILYALHPMKKGTPLTSSISSIYDHVKKPKRMETVKQFYNFDCDCRACIENWFDPEPYGDVVRKELAALPNRTYQIAVSLLREVESTCGELSGRSQKENLSDPKLLTSTKMMVTKAWRNFSMPSTVLLRTTSTMKAVYDMFLTSDVLHAPSCGQ
ncbi:hypothetical protein QAD02_001292 [Eretmocerus hayati]|uniref:Uncharacterized protein n=1 Tax=Eretmocerus hayati TaxID=131215 RepID=A0ACC2NGK3_9HYME|nr:hypothetical protein QAD02_001292 [Eretmocerus hayati]